jgi:hypothetical protein
MRIATPAAVGIAAIAMCVFGTATAHANDTAGTRALPPVAESVTESVTESVRGRVCNTIPFSDLSRFCVNGDLWEQN